MQSVTLDFRVCTESTRAARASFAALSQALAALPISGALAERLRALAPGAEAAAGLMRVGYEAFQHGGVVIIEARLAPGDLYLDFIAALVAERPDLSARHDHGWPVLSQTPAREPDVCIGVDLAERGDICPRAVARAWSGTIRVFNIEEVPRVFSLNPALLQPLRRSKRGPA